MEHIFMGEWITDGEFADLAPRNVFHRQLEKVDLPCDEHRNRHILFRKRFTLAKKPESAVLFITADDYYKLYINGLFVSQGPAPSYHFQYGYNAVDVTEYLHDGLNILAVHTLYQGLINRVWVSGDNRHGLLCDLIADGCCILKSDAGFLTHPHTGYTEMGIAGYQTQFLERCDAGAPEVGFTHLYYDDSAWEPACPRKYADYTLTEQKTKQLVFEDILPRSTERNGNTVRIDFGGMYVGYLNAQITGQPGSVAEIRYGQELNEDGSVRYALRSNCEYREEMILSGRRDGTDWFDYKSFRYVELILPTGAELLSVSLRARHYPFACTAHMQPEMQENAVYRAIWELCMRSMKYGVQEVIQDCMEREKGFYLGDGCYTALTHYMMTGDDSIVVKLIDDAFASEFITEGMVTCLDCSMMQEIAEYPLMLISLILWRYRLKGDKAYLAKCYKGIVPLLESYRRQYEKNGLLQDLDKWCVIEWPANFRDGYDADITEGKVCHTPHIVMNAHYLEAVHSANMIAQELGLPSYRDEEYLRGAILNAFYDAERHLFVDSLGSSHASYVANVFAYAYRLCPDVRCEETILAMIEERGVTGVSLFATFPLFCGLIRHGKRTMVDRMLLDDGAWCRMLREGATATFEGWGKDTKWNTSLFHLTMSYGAIFMTDAPLDRIFA